MTDGKSSQRIPRRDGVAILYSCEDCGHDHWRKFHSMFGHYIREIECPQCGHTVRGEHEK
jgi:predicted RNA-binding Zn-ribbon protein involved in translation (DUF1610 family)